MLDIRIQKLFLVTIILKIGFSFLGLLLHDPWYLGLWFPLSFMGAYIVIGWKRRDRDVTDEKFADSCYYLGFIFTIASIIFCLIDLPNINEKDVFKDITIRFGAAMLSTVAGLVVRVYLVNFKRDVTDAIKETEDDIINASHRLREQLVIAYEKMRDFQSGVDIAAKATIESVKMQIEKLSKDHADKLTGFFEELVNKNQEAFTKALDEVKSASLRLSDSVDGYSQGMQTNLGSIEVKVTAFANSVTERLKTTTFPDDYFAKHLATPLDQLKKAAENISVNMLQTSEEVAKSTVVLSGALKNLKTKATATENSLETVLRITAQQQTVLDTAQGQLTTLDKLGETLAGFGNLLNNTVIGINSMNDAIYKLTGRIEAIVLEGAEERKHLELLLTKIVSKLDANANVSELVAAQLSNSASATQKVANKLDSVATPDFETAKTLDMIGGSAKLVITKIDTAVEQFNKMIRQLVAIDETLLSQSSQLKLLNDQIKDLKVVGKSFDLPDGAIPTDTKLTGATVESSNLSSDSRRWWQFGHSK